MGKQLFQYGIGPPHLRRNSEGYPYGGQCPFYMLIGYGYLKFLLHIRNPLFYGLIVSIFHIDAQFPDLFFVAFGDEGNEFVGNGRYGFRTITRLDEPWMILHIRIDDGHRAMGIDNLLHGLKCEAGEHITARPQVHRLPGLTDKSLHRRNGKYAQPCDVFSLEWVHIRRYFQMLPDGMVGNSGVCGEESPWYILNFLLQIGKEFVPEGFQNISITRILFILQCIDNRFSQML